MDSSANEICKRIYANWDTLTDCFDLQNVIFINEAYLFAYDYKHESYILIEYEKSDKRTIAKWILFTDKVIEKNNLKLEFCLSVKNKCLNIIGFKKIDKDFEIDFSEVKNGSEKRSAIYNQLRQLIVNLEFEHKVGS